MFQNFEYRKLGDFTYHVIPDPVEIRKHLIIWIMREWEKDHHEAPHEHWTVSWMNTLPKMEFSLEIIHLEDIIPNPDLMSMDEFLVSLQERADDREESFLRGQSVEPLLVNRDGNELMDGYTRYTLLRKYGQHETYVYMGTITT